MADEKRGAEGMPCTCDDGEVPLLCHRHVLLATRLGFTWPGVVRAAQEVVEQAKRRTLPAELINAIWALAQTLEGEPRG